MTKPKDMTTEEYHSILHDLIFADSNSSHEDFAVVSMEDLDNAVLDEWKRRKEAKDEEQ